MWWYTPVVRLLVGLSQIQVQSIQHMPAMRLCLKTKNQKDITWSQNGGAIEDIEYKAAWVYIPGSCLKQRNQHSITFSFPPHYLLTVHRGFCMWDTVQDSTLQCGLLFCSLLHLEGYFTVWSRGTSECPTQTGWVWDQYSLRLVLNWGVCVCVCCLEPFH